MEISLSYHFVLLNVGIYDIVPIHENCAVKFSTSLKDSDGITTQFYGHQIWNASEIPSVKWTPGPSI